MGLDYACIVHSHGLLHDCDYVVVCYTLCELYTWQFVYGKLGLET